MVQASSAHAHEEGSLWVRAMHAAHQVWGHRRWHMLMLLLLLLLLQLLLVYSRMVVRKWTGTGRWLGRSLGLLLCVLLPAGLVRNFKRRQRR